ncbi:Gfo/Idh/MocA family protein [Polynucleobacter sp. MWH-UH25E]|uniref:Gfo/Idh/MocA family protein n=1 Tax=Polynucleobacter sp. MWH-UH25E TaxID=1855616 RepID=UPI001BFCF38D|nr:Gfo/Idh/MocA family oxidoreductase [Polynucleobacter sp. MWH-UH25E]QWD62355.1 Gfo/Idh/MocA family oxidoreductase [Polynucleobacter sp. MWH-UH25E]
MNFSNVLFVGLGGAGQRHLRILNKLMPKKTKFSAFRRVASTPLLRPDFTVDADNTIESVYNLHLFDELTAAFKSKPDLTVISTPTSYHREVMMMAIESASGILVEKPWAENLRGFSDFESQVLSKKLPFHISFQRRFHPQIKKVKQALISGVIGMPVAATFSVYSNVPSWHDYEDWRGLYAVRSDLGGGVLLTEIHEIDLANWFFGLPGAVFCTGGNRGPHKLEVEDAVQLLLLYTNYSVQITLYFMHRKPSRSFHIVGTEGEIYWSEGNNRLDISSFSAQSEINSIQLVSNEEMFEEQAKYFLNSWTIGDTKESLSNAFGSLAIVDAAKRSMKSGKPEPCEYMNS